MNICEICGKGVLYGQNIRHRHSGAWALRAQKTKRVQKPNLQTVRAIVKGSPCHLKVCTRCLKAGKVQRPS